MPESGYEQFQRSIVSIAWLPLLLLLLLLLFPPVLNPSARSPKALYLRGTSFATAGAEEPARLRAKGSGCACFSASWLFLLVLHMEFENLRVRAAESVQLYSASAKSFNQGSSK